MSLPPGTRISDGLETFMAMKVVDGMRMHRDYYRGLVEGLTLGAVAGIMLGLLCAALAWSHLGG